MKIGVPMDRDRDPGLPAPRARTVGRPSDLHFECWTLAGKHWVWRKGWRNSGLRQIDDCCSLPNRERG